MTHWIRPLVARAQTFGLVPRLSASVRLFSTTGDLEIQFKQSVDDSKKLKDDPGNEAKLKMYSLFKQASVGPNTTPKPGAFDIVGKYKWQAWANLGDKSKEGCNERVCSVRGAAGERGGDDKVTKQNQQTFKQFADRDLFSDPQSGVVM